MVNGRRTCSLPVSWTGLKRGLSSGMAWGWSMDGESIRLDGDAELGRTLSPGDGSGMVKGWRTYSPSAEVGRAQSPCLDAGKRTCSLVQSPQGPGTCSLAVSRSEPGKATRRPGMNSPRASFGHDWPSGKVFRQGATAPRSEREPPCGRRVAFARHVAHSPRDPSPCGGRSRRTASGPDLRSRQLEARTRRERQGARRECGGAWSGAAAPHRRGVVQRHQVGQPTWLATVPRVVATVTAR